MNSTVKAVLWIVAIVLVGWGLMSLKGKDEGAKSTGPVKLGFIAPLTGDAASIGQNAKVAVELAVKELNAAGGNFEVVYEDGKCNGADASSAASKLINVDKVSAIIGGLCSGETAAFASMAEQAKVTTLSYCSSAPAITTAGDYIFRNYPSDTYQGSFGAEYVKNTLKKTKVAIVYAKTDWGTGIKDVFKAKFTELGGQVVAEEGYEQTARDLRAELTKVKSSGADLVYFLGYTEASIPAVKQAAELKLGIPMLGGDAWDDAKIWKDAGKAGDGAMYTVVSSNPPESFKANLKAATGSDEVGLCSPTAYDATKILAQVIKKVGSDSTAIKNELYKVDYEEGVSSVEIKFDQNGDLVGASYVVKTVKGGKAEVVQ